MKRPRITRTDIALSVACAIVEGAIAYRILIVKGGFRRA